jgi:hypothetical protein
LSIRYGEKVLDVIMAIPGLGFSVHLRGTNKHSGAFLGGSSHAKLLGSIYDKEKRGVIVGCKLHAGKYT